LRGTLWVVFTVQMGHSCVLLGAFSKRLILV
jgi:hypothetical protein